MNGMASSFKFGGISLKNKRKINMDSLILLKSVISGQEAILAAVCDGVGSLANGVDAAAISAKSLTFWFKSLGRVDNAGLILRDKISEISREVADYSKRNRSQTAATLSALLIIGERYFIAHLGDSRIYAFAKKECKLLTYDMVNEKGALTSYIGKPDPEIYYTEGPAEPGSYIVCSDGLYKRMDMFTLEKHLREKPGKSPGKTASLLAETAIQSGESDNITIAVIQKRIN